MNCNSASGTTVSLDIFPKLSGICQNLVVQGKDLYKSEHFSFTSLVDFSTIESHMDVNKSIIISVTCVHCQFHSFTLV